MTASTILTMADRDKMITRVRIEYDPKVADELQALSDLLNTPVYEPFITAATHEAKHQVFRWGSESDARKTSWDWFWTLGYLGGKAAQASLIGDWSKAKHHTITAAAMLANWHKHICDAEASAP